MTQLNSSFLQFFDTLEDPRHSNHNKRHYLEDILVITILGTICGCNNWVEICDFGEAKQDWLSTFLKLPNGIPSHDTFARVFALLNASQFEACFRSWVQSLELDLEGAVIAIDGKTLRGSGNRRKKVKPLHLVSAWASDFNMLLGQVKTDNYSNEITAIPKLLKMIDLRGTTVTLDAMGCQKEIATEILNGGGDYVISLKDNQPKLHEIVKAIFHVGETRQYKKILHRRKVEKLHGHGRFERRRYTLISARDNIAFQLRFPGIKGLGMLEVTRRIQNEVETGTRYFLTSHSHENIDKFTKAARKHWEIEIGLHWSLDVSFDEDHNRSRIGNSALNLATVRRLALCLLKKDKKSKNGIACKRKKAGWDHRYLINVLSGS